MKVSIIIPCYNEEKALPNLFQQLEPAIKDLNTEIIFIDDGSTDNTLKILKEYKKPIKIIKHKTNYNLGAALRTGFKHATGDVIIPLDCDCTFPPAKIKELLSYLDDHTDIVNASPYHPLGRLDNVPIYRRLLSKSIITIYKVLMGRKAKGIYTYTVMIRAYKKHVIKNVKFKSNDFLCCAEILIYALLKGYKVKEFPTTLYTRQYGESSIKLFRVILSHLKFIFKLLEIRVFIK